MKLDAVVHTKYCNFCLPKNPTENNFAETVKIMKPLFELKSSLCAIVTRLCENLKLTSQPTNSSGYFLYEKMALDSTDNCYITEILIQ